MRNTENIKESPSPKTDAEPKNTQTGMSLDEIYHVESEQAYLEKFQAGVDYYMMQAMEGLL